MTDAEKTTQLARSGTCYRSVWSFWSFVLVTILAVYLAALPGIAFLGASMEVMREFGQTTYHLSVEHYGPFVQQVVDEWDQRIARNWPGFQGHFVILSSVGFSCFLFWIFIRSGRGVPLGEMSDLPQDKQAFLHEQIEKFGNYVSIEFGKPGIPPFAVHKFGGNLYLPYSYLDRVFRGEFASQEMRFLLAHELVHETSHDTFIYSLLRTVIFLTAFSLLFFLAAPTLYSFIFMLPRILVNESFKMLIMPLVAFLSAALLLGCAATAYMIVPGFAALREYFADRIAIKVAGESGSLNADSTRSAPARAFSNWAMELRPGDREGIASGIVPKATGLVCGSLALWLLVRTIILIVYPVAADGLIFVYDIAALLTGFAFLSAIPIRSFTLRDGTGPTLALMLVCSVLVVSMIGTLTITNHLLGRPLETLHWGKIFVWPPMLVFGLCVLFLFFLAMRGVSTGAHGEGRTKALVLGLLSVPSLVFSLFIGAMALFPAGTSLYHVLNSLWSQDFTFLIGAVFFTLVYGVTISLIIRNFCKPSYKSVGLEVFVLALFWGLIGYLFAAIAEQFGKPAVNGKVGKDFITPALNELGSPNTVMISTAITFFIVWFVVMAIFYWPRIAFFKRMRAR